MGNRPARFLYGPLFGFLMSLIFSKANPIHSSALWYVSEKPPHYSDEEYSSQWQPLRDHPYYTITTYFPSALLGVDGFGDETPAASNVYVRRRRPDGYKIQSKRQKINGKPKRRRTTTTTTEAYYYDDYNSEDEYDTYSVEIRTTPKPFRKRRRTTTTPAYEDYENYFVQSTTKPAKKRKKPTFSSASLEELDDVDITTSKRFQAQIETTTTEETDNVTTMSPMTTFAGYNGTNLHDNVTFTYGPPTSNDANFGSVYNNYGPPSLSRLDHAPFINWYNHFKSKNDVVKRVQDIVGEDDFVDFAHLQQ